MIVERFEDGRISEIIFETDALYDGTADFGILYLAQEEAVNLSDGILDTDSPNDDSSDTNVDGWITEQFDSVEDNRVEGWITKQFETVEDNGVVGWISDQPNLIDNRQVIGQGDNQPEDISDISSGNLLSDNLETGTAADGINGFIRNDADEGLSENGTEETDTGIPEYTPDETDDGVPGVVIDEAEDGILAYILDETDAEILGDTTEEKIDGIETADSEKTAAIEETTATADVDTKETEASSASREIESYLLDEINPEEFDIHEIETEAEISGQNLIEFETEEDLSEENLEENETEAETELTEEGLRKKAIETGAEALEDISEETDTETETELPEEILEDTETEKETESSEESLEEAEPETESFEENLKESEPETKPSEESLEEAEPGTEPSEESLEESETETETSEENLEEAETESLWPEEGPEELETETEELTIYPAQSFAYEGEVFVFVTAPEGALPKNTSMVVTPVDDDDDIASIAGAVTDESTEKTVRRIDAVDIAFFAPDGMEIEPLIPVKVRMVTQQRQSDEETVVVHLDDEGNAEKVDNTSIYQSGETTHYIFESLEKEYSDEGISKADVGQIDGTSTEDNREPDDALQITEFETEQFSIYAVVYTVDFEYAVDGKTYQFSLPGGGFVSFTDLVEVLGITHDDNNGENKAETDAAEMQIADGMLDVTASDMARKFAENVESVEFSSSELVWVGKTDAETTVGALKEANGLECEYSLELTEDQIEEINHTEVESGDWALISVQPFTSEEELTVTMKNGDVFTIQVTDAQISTMFLSDSGELFEVTVTYSEAANIPDGSTLRVTEFSKEDEKYEYARNAVLADKKAKGEWVDLSSFGLAAMDISILNPDGEEIEPEAPVQVDIQIKELPGVEDLNEIEDTLEIQHHVEVEDGVVVETVFDGNAEISFRLGTDEIVASEWAAVDPNSVRDEDFTLSGSDSGDFGDKWAESDTRKGYLASFETPLFSTFTVTWETPASEGYRMNLDGKSFVLVNESHSAALVAENINNNTRLKAVEFSPSDDSITKWYFQRISNNDWYYYITDENGRYLNIGDGNNSYIRVSDNPQRIYIDRNNDLFRLQRSNNSNSTAVNLYGGVISGGFGPYNDRGENEWFRAYYPAGEATIHYVDEEERDLPVSNGTISNSTLLNNYAYLIYDIEGGDYEYKETYIRRNSTDTSIKAYLRWTGTNWQYTTNGSNWSNVNGDDDIYVVYKEKKTPTEGGTPTLVELDEDEKPESPTVMKDSTVNGDGTNTLSLSVTSHTTPREVLKLADVIVIFDRSGSMKQNINNSNEASTVADRRMTLLQNAVNSLADDLIGDDSVYIYTDPDGVRHKQIEMSLVSFSTEATDASAFTDNADTFKEWVRGLTPDGGTNWEQALQKANEASVDSGRATFVIFVTDGEPTFRMTRMTDTDSSLNGDMYGNGSTYYNSDNVYGTGSSDNLKDDTEYGRNYRAALAQALSIVSKNKNLYMIGVGPEVANLEQFNSDAGADGYYPATSSDDLTSAFEDIKKRIAAMAGYSDFQISDGITDLTQTVQKSTLVNFVDDDFTYYKGKVDHYENVYATQADVDKGLAANVGDVIKKYPVVTTWESWDPTSEDCAKAKYENGAVVWNMGSNFMPQEGYTYQVRFKVWPSQAAYDLLADLNNGKKNYSELTDEEKAQIKEPTTEDGMYTLKTNSVTSYNYKDATIVDGTVTPSGDDLLVPAGKFDDVDPLELTTKPLRVKKQWHNNYTASREPVSSITMELYGVSADGSWSQDFKTITLNAAGNWQADDNYISYGLVTYNEETDGDEKIYETGHDFTLRETDDEAHYYELNAGIFRPMFINNVPTILERLDSPPTGMSESAFHYSDGSHHYYRLNGKIYQDTQSDTLLIATNSRRSYMDLKKVVVDESNNPVLDDTEFEYKIKFTVPTGIANYDTLEKYIWFSVYDSVAGRTLSPREYTCNGVITPAQESSAFSGPEYANYLVAISEQEVTLKVKQGWNVRFLNLPIGTTYSFEETNIPEDYNFVKAEVGGTRWIANMVDGTDQGQAVTMTDLPSNTSGINSDTDISGTIDFANARYSTTYTNKTLTQHVNILKTTQDGTTPLSDAVFSLYTESGYAADPKQAAKTGLTSGEDGMIDLGVLACGKYYLVETSAPAGYIPLSDPVEITVTGTGVTYNQSDSSLSQSGDGINYNQEKEVYTLTVTNNAGYELPSTGGSGTRRFYFFGSVLILGAAILFWGRRRTI